MIIALLCSLVLDLRALDVWLHAPTKAGRAKKCFLAKQFANTIRVHYRDFEHAYVFDCAALLPVL